jgi:hypothetical protein
LLDGVKKEILMTRVGMLANRIGSARIISGLTTGGISIGSKSAGPVRPTGSKQDTTPGYYKNKPVSYFTQAEINLHNLGVINGH